MHIHTCSLWDKSACSMTLVSYFSVSSSSSCWCSSCSSFRCLHSSSVFANDLCVRYNVTLWLGANFHWTTMGHCDNNSVGRLKIMVTRETMVQSTIQVYCKCNHKTSCSQQNNLCWLFHRPNIMIKTWH